MTDMELANRFNSLVRKPVIKKRTCLSCGKVFVSKNAGNRRCCFCEMELKNFGKMAESGRVNIT